MFLFKLNSISSSPIEPSPTPFKMILTFFSMLHMGFMRSIAFFILCLVIKFVFIWLIGIFCFIVSRLVMISSVISSVCRLQELRVIMALVYNIATIFISFYRNIIRFVKMLVGCFCLKGDMCRGTVMFAFIMIEIPQVQI